MIGVMPALAVYDDEDTVELSVTVTELFVLGITITGDGAFGSVVQGSSISLSSPLVLTVESPTAVTVDAELRDTEGPYPVLTSGLFVEHMTVTVDAESGTSVDAFTISHPIGEESYDISATITVPSAYDLGTETATLVFWLIS
jgi:hypothetical protein